MADGTQFLIVTRGNVSLHDTLCQALAEALTYESWAEPLDVDQLSSMVEVIWSRSLTVNDGRSVHRVRVTPDPLPEGSADSPDSIIRSFCEQLRDLTKDADSGIVHFLKFYDPEARQQHEASYREIYELEMRLREVLSFIFLDEYSDAAYTFLNQTVVKPQSGVGDVSAEYLSAHDENQLFHILFNEYAKLNDPTSTKPSDLIPLIKGSGSYDTLRDAVARQPVKTDKYAGFIASLRVLVDPIEKVRNCVAHGRDYPNGALDDYNTARPKLLQAIEDFWQARRLEVSVTDAVAITDHVEAKVAPANPMSVTETLGDVAQGGATGQSTPDSTPSPPPRRKRKGKGGRSAAPRRAKSTSRRRDS